MSRAKGHAKAASLRRKALSVSQPSGNAKAKPAKAKAKPKVVSAEASVPAGPVSVQLTLPDCLDSSAAADVKSLLLARRGSDIVVDASQVRRLGAQSLQVLISAARTWQADGRSYTVANASSEFVDTIALMGLSRESLRL